MTTLREQIRYMNALIWHLQYNFYPNMSYMYDMADKAIQLCNDGKPDNMVRSGLEVTAGAIVEDLHLSEFLQEEDYE